MFALLRRCAATVLLLSAMAMTAVLASAPNASADTLAQCGGATKIRTGGVTWQCAFSDEFNGDALDTGQWVVQQTATSGYHTGPSGAQACYVDDRRNVSVSGGYLRLTARAASAPFTCHSPSGDYRTRYTSGQISSYYGFHQTYGRFEVRAKLPQATVKGLQETFWMLPVDPVHYGRYPMTGELDFAEFYSQYPDLDIPYLHYWYDPATIDQATNTNIVTAYTCRINRTGFNTYTMEWMPGWIRILVNGRTCILDNYVPLGLDSPAPFDQPFFLILTQALGVGTNRFSSTGTPLPATTLVDYVRAWRPSRVSLLG